MEEGEREGSRGWKDGGGGDGDGERKNNALEGGQGRVGERLKTEIGERGRDT